MSRIYDALKKAEQETNSHAPVRDQISSSDALFAPSTMQTPPLPETAVTTVTSAEESESSASVVDDISPVAIPTAIDIAALASCRSGNWAPSSNLISFVDRPQGSSVGAEQFRRLRSRLYQIREKQPLKRILVSSSIPGEGKTFVCANLARALARHGRTRVLLIDADLRKPSLHAALGAPDTPGLSDYLQGTADELAVIQRGSLDGLFFIAGGCTQASADTFSGSRFQTLMAHAAELFDWVIVDSSPVVPVSDATVVAQHCDGVLLVVKAETTPFDLAQKARDEFRNSVVLGVVLNHVTDQSSYTPYYYSAYKGAAPSSGPATE